MVFLFKIILISVILCINCEEKKLYNDIIDVETKNLDSIFKDSENLLIFFYQDSCTQCLFFKSIMTDLLLEIRKSNLNVNLFRIDITANPKLGTLFDIDYMPSLKLIQSKFNITSEYNGDPFVKDIIQFLYQ